MSQQESVSSVGAQAEYEAALARGTFLIQLCNSCKKHVFYPRQLCPHCGSRALTWVQPSGYGRVYATTTVCLNPNKPYNVSIVELDEGVRLMSRVEGVHPDHVVIGQRVKAEVVQQGDAGLLIFQSVSEAS